MKCVLHIDMDAFYASVEQKDDPRLVGRPVAVGGQSRRGVVAAASYEARPFGVRSAMPMHEALRRCPELVVITPRMDRYVEVSEIVFDIFHRYTPMVEGLSLDEAFLDVTASRSLFGDGASIAERIRADVRRETGLTASAGVATTKFVAKIASDMNKPDGVTVVPGDVVSFLAPLPIERMWGIGPKTTPSLHALGVRTFGDLARVRDDVLVRALGTFAHRAKALARGEDPRDVEPDRDAKSIGAERTYERDLVGRDMIVRSLLEHASRVAARLTGEGLVAGGVAIKIKSPDFSILTRRMTLSERVADTTSLHESAKLLVERLAATPSDLRARLTGLSAFDLAPAVPVQRSLFEDDEASAPGKRRREIEHVLLRAREKFGDAPITLASLLENDGEARVAPADPVMKRRGDVSGRDQS